MSAAEQHAHDLDPEKLGRLAEQDCQVVLERVHTFLDNELDEASCEVIRLHLEACERCVEDFDAELAIKQLVNRCCQGQKAPQTLRVSIMTSITTWHREG
ncbi:mycothiol system anti-sigma-R factor [Enemella dayhoffiae]|uniref:Mycothiol system anti-sigma-R factor n=1 Tax=Enemella dayhoffiae TaxID=2016507 RepID=A0A255GUN4_9ACTN|nr:mycothiol system anti-sigma-R factor [Enemella dayhoffiae]OYO19350.1 mycothiol system anti-sigma-R factor [Enemella dayhoffiae]